MPWLAGKEKMYLDEVISSNSFAGNGPFTKRCHAFLEQKFEVPHVLLTTSCTAALELAAMAHNLGQGDEIIVPSYTFVSTASAFLRTGASVIFADMDPDTLMLDPNDVKNRITERTKAVVAVHYAGFAADLTALNRICDAHGLILIEDAAQGLASSSNEYWLGTVGSMGCISFHETKNIHCGLGGALFINDPEFFDRTENIWERGTNRTKMFKGLVDKYSWVETGSSFYPSELQAAFLLAQLEEMGRNLDERSLISESYDLHLSKLAESGRMKQQYRAPSLSWNHHAVVIILESQELADKVRIHLKSRKINAYIGYVPLHTSEMGLKMGWKAEDLPVTHAIASRVLRLPIHHQMTVDDVERVCNEIATCL